MWFIFWVFLIIFIVVLLLFASFQPQSKTTTSVCTLKCVKEPHPNAKHESGFNNMFGNNSNSRDSNIDFSKCILTCTEVNVNDKTQQISHDVDNSDDDELDLS
uniref:Uncharacterized protein n=1 Tax=Pithovirus LCPAC404 TaxID=2506597 RepID=A0A481ZBZ1_9VIRU|nr:MAG: hypothetical protein LCPAC404_01570 [Pithovirus LCPAC404]